VREVAEALVASLGRGTIEIAPEPDAPHEAGLLTLDCAKARARLGWRPNIDFAETIALTAGWYGAWAAGEDMIALTRKQILRAMPEAR
jgi:CDP-glucose 4,6-dehydratase